LFPEDPKSFILYQAKCLPAFIRVKLDVPPTDGAAKVGHYYSPLGCSRTERMITVPRRG
jgi:hypothetical protein